jgi:hypothetical protein
MNVLHEGFNIFTDILRDTNNSSKTKSKRKNNEILHETQYESNRLNNGFKNTNKKGKIRMEKARDPVKTGIVNKLMRHSGSNKGDALNQCSRRNCAVLENDSEFSDNPDVLSPESISTVKEPASFLGESSRLLDNRFYERNITNPSGLNDTYLNQYEPSKFDMRGSPSSANAVNNSSSMVNRLQTERELAMKQGYSNFGQGKDNTFGVVADKDFVHINMVPNFKSKSYGNDIRATENRNNTYQRTLDTFTGNDIKIAKTEQKPLFGPLTGITNVWGTPSITSFVEDRYMPGKERKNELPFLQQRVTTGLNLGYNEVNKNGDNFRVLPKTIDEIRTLDKIQKSYTYSPVKGMMGQNKGPVIGDVKKYKPETTAYLGDYNLVPNLGYIRAPALFGEVNPSNMGTVNRGVSQQNYVGPAGASTNEKATPNNLREKFSVSHKENFKQAEPRNVILVEGLNARPNTNSYQPTNTERDKQQDYVGPAGTSTVTKGHAFNMITNILDATKRNLTENTDRFGAGHGGNEHHGHVIDYKDLAKSTIKQHTENVDRFGAGHGGNEHHGHVVDYKDLAKSTIKQHTENVDRFGAGHGGNEHHGHVVDYKDLAKSTIKQHTENVDRFGAGHGGNEHHGHVVDYKDLAKSTIRHHTENVDRFGAGHGGNEHLGHVIDYKDIAKSTIRQHTENVDRFGAGHGGNEQYGHVVDYKDVAKSTIKQHTENTDRYGAAHTGDKQYGKAVDYSDVAKGTMRQHTENTDRTGVVTGDGQKGIAIDFKNIAKLNKKIFTEKNNNAGNIGGNVNKGYTINYELFTPDLTMRELHSKLDRSAGGLGAGVKPRTRDDANNSYVNIEREVIAKGRTPTKSNYIKGPTIDNTCVELREQIQLNREFAPSSIITINDKLPFTMHTPTGRMVTNTRINNFTELSLDQNPFINNVVHKSVNIY